MIIRMDGPSSAAVDAARDGLNQLLQQWQADPDALVTLPTPPGPPPGQDKVVDPVALAALVVSLTSAVLAVVDLADRITKRRRTAALIEHARALAEHGVTVRILDQDHTLELIHATPDELLSHVAPDAAHT